MTNNNHQHHSNHRKNQNNRHQQSNAEQRSSGQHQNHSNHQANPHHSHNGHSNQNTRKKKNTKISQHFSYGDFACNCGKCDGEIKTSLGLIGGLEFLRTKLNARINIVHAYECEDARKSNKGKNYHAQGIAADIQVENKTPREVFCVAEEVPEFRGIGLDLDENCLHVDTRKDEEVQRWVIDRSKRIVLTADNRNHYLDA